MDGDDFSDSELDAYLAGGDDGGDEDNRVTTTSPELPIPTASTPPRPSYLRDLLNDPVLNQGPFLVSDPAPTSPRGERGGESIGFRFQYYPDPYLPVLFSPIGSPEPGPEMAPPSPNPAPVSPNVVVGSPELWPDMAPAAPNYAPISPPDYRVNVPIRQAENVQRAPSPVAGPSHAYNSLAAEEDNVPDSVLASADTSSYVAPYDFPIGWCAPDGWANLGYQFARVRNLVWLLVCMFPGYHMFKTHHVHLMLHYLG